MVNFWLIFSKVTTLILTILIGFVAAKKLKTEQESIAALLFYILSPIVFFYNIAKLPINLSLLSIPLLVYSIACLLCLIFYNLGKKIWQDPTKNILALSAGNGNTGYFGLPIAVAIFDQQTVGIYILAVVGIVLYENSLGYFIAAKGNYDLKTCLIKIIKLPMLHAFIAGCLVSKLGVPIPRMFDELVTNIRGCYTILGMMLIGLGIITNIKIKEIDWLFIFLSFLAKFVIWPIIIGIIINLDKYFFNYYHPQVHQALMLLAIVPLAANTIVIASLLNIHPEKAALAILFSMIFSLLYIPLMVTIFIN